MHKGLGTQTLTKRVHKMLAPQHTLLPVWFDKNMRFLPIPIP